MRKTWWLASLVSAAALVLPVLAQQPVGGGSAGSFFTGVDPRKLNMKYVNPSAAMKVHSPSTTLQPTGALRSPSVVNMSTMFPRITLGSWPPKLPSFGLVKTPAAPQPKTMTVNGGAVNMFKLN
ncbi:MAG: hypothetical protein NZO58_03905 [Gemmataceae bacterium]|nr:hypothetical protein [Gemmataceae bacterium]